MSALVNAFTWGTAMLVVVFPSLWYGYDQYQVVERPPSDAHVRAPDVAKDPEPLPVGEDVEPGQLPAGRHDGDDEEDEDEEPDEGDHSGKGKRGHDRDDDGND